MISIVRIILWMVICVSVNSEESIGYLTQCGPVDFSKGQNLGRVNVFAFLDPLWKYSYGQAIMLNQLKQRLENSDFSDVNFFVITASSDESTLDEIDDNIEIEAWKEISSIDPEIFQSLPNTMSIDDLNKLIDPNIILVRDNTQLEIWRKLRVSKDQVLVVDSCGKLTYQVIVPWSIMYFPYVKAAILSTYEEDPCGPCDVYQTTTSNDYYSEYNDTISSTTVVMETTTDNISSNEEENLTTIPIRIIMRAPHLHENDSQKYTYLVLKIGDPDYHEHLDSVDNALRFDGQKTNVKKTLQNDDNNMKYIYDKDESPGLYGEVADYWRNYKEYEENEPTETPNQDYSETKVADGEGISTEEGTDFPGLIIELEKNNTNDKVPIETVDKNVDNVSNNKEKEDRNDLIAHYSKLLPWIYYVLSK